MKNIVKHSYQNECAYFSMAAPQKNVFTQKVYSKYRGQASQAVARLALG